VAFPFDGNVFVETKTLISDYTYQAGELNLLKNADSCVFRIEEIPGTSRLGF
jgi:hypothetical protein